MRHFPPLLALALLLPHFAHADEAPGGASDNQSAFSLDFDVRGQAKVDGKDFHPGMRAKADVYAEVAKVIEGPEGSNVMYLRPLEARKNNVDGTNERFDVSAEPRPFVVENDWKMFDAEGNVTLDPRFAIRVIMPYHADISQAMFEVNWNECEGPITGNYTGMPCNKNRGLSDDYMAYLNANYLPCINAGTAAAGVAPAVSVHIQHDGTVADEKHAKGSLHKVGRALDAMQITTKDAKGNTNLFDFTVTNPDRKLSSSCKPAGTPVCKFFEAFRQCWHQKQVARKCPARKDGPIGTIGWEDAKHIHHHLHTSYPFCPNSKGHFITDLK
jgi:hypothetical protein